MQDQEIVHRVLAGDREAFRPLVERHQGKVIAILTRMVGDPEQAEELSQEAFVRAYQGLAGFRGDAQFSTWLIQIALHVARSHLKQRTRLAKVVSLEELLERGGTETEAWQDHRSSHRPDDRLEQGELAIRLERALDLLPPSHREAFVLKHVQEMSYEEIAKITGDSVGSLKVRTHRARGLLKKHLSADNRFPNNDRAPNGESARSEG